LRFTVAATGVKIVEGTVYVSINDASSAREAGLQGSLAVRPRAGRGGRWVFGFDSGIAWGDVGVYRPDEGKRDFIFLKFAYRSAQLASLARLGGYYVDGLGLPTAVIVSRDLRYWYKLHLGGTTGYNHFVNVAAQGDRVFAATGSELRVFTIKDVEAAFAGEPLLRFCGARF